MIRGVGEEIKEDMISQKVLKSLTMIFNVKVSAIEEMSNLKDLKVNQFLSTPIAYEMRIGREKSEPKEAMFKVSKKAKDHKDHQDWSSYESN